MTKTKANEHQPAKKSYYDGSAEPVLCTSLAVRKLEKRRVLTRTSQRLVVVLVGLPGRGKSFIGRKLHAFLTWRGNACKVFNVGKYRREANRKAAHEDDDASANQREEVGACDAKFFDTSNAEATKLREEVAMMALQDMLLWLDGNRDDNRNPDRTLNHQLSDDEHEVPTTSAPNTPATPSRSDIQRELNEGLITSRIAIFDATNSTKSRRDLIMETCKQHCRKTGTQPIGIIFIESLCDDKELLDENFRYKIKNSPDFKGLSEEEAMEDLRERARKYEERYQTIDDDSLSYIKMYNFSSKILANNIYGRAAKMIVPALMAWHIGERPVFLCRAGKTFADDEYFDLTSAGSALNLAQETGTVMSGVMDYNLDSSKHSEVLDRSRYKGQWRCTLPENSPSRTQLDASVHSQFSTATRDRIRTARGNKLDDAGGHFRVALAEFVAREGAKFMESRNHALKGLATGTSITGSSTVITGIHADADELNKTFSRSLSYDALDEILEGKDGVGIPSFPCYILTSTMPRAIQTATWDNLPFEMYHVSNLNPLDKGDFAGMEMEEIMEFEPEWYSELSRSPFTTRFPGGECYKDLVARLESVTIEIEQQVAPVVVVSHVSVIQVLLAYFRQTPVAECTKIEVPMHTVIEVRPLLGGGWTERQHQLIPDECSDGSFSDGEEGPNTPIWGDANQKNKGSMVKRPSSVGVAEQS